MFSLVLTVLALVACGDDSPTPSTPPPAVEPAPAPAPAAKPKLEPPPEDSYIGRSRVVNLIVDGKGATQTVDVWALRSFTHAEVQLAEGIEVGTASDWFGIPKGSRAVVVEAGAGPGADPVTTLYAPKADEAISTVLQLGRSGAVEGMSYYEAGETSMNRAKPPPPGQGMVVLFASQLRAHDAALAPTTGGYAYYVGTGKSSCAPRRGVDPDAKSMTMLGGTTDYIHDVSPGTSIFRLHRRDNKDKCAGPGVLDIEVDVAADSRTLVLIYTEDLKSLKALKLPMAD